MFSLIRSWRAKSLVLFSLLSLVILSACGSSSTSSTSSSSTPNANANISITVGSKDDTEAQLLGQMYALLLEKAGYHVTEKLKLGGNAIVSSAIQSGAIDLYPEFTATGLAQLGLQTAHDVQKDYQTVKTGYEQKYKITWLNLSPLNDTYGICTSQTNADKYHVSKISDLSPLASGLVLSTPPDGKSDPSVLPAVKPAYGFTFKQVNVLDEAITYEAVLQGKADFNICYTTSALITKNKFVLLQDDKNVFPIYQPAPIVRQDALQKAPGIAAVLNKLAPLLTSSISSQLQLEVLNGKTVREVATVFLQQQHLIS
jgi:osmoprotectant transport system substrate-binding protein